MVNFCVIVKRTMLSCLNLVSNVEKETFPENDTLHNMNTVLLRNFYFIIFMTLNLETGQSTRGYKSPHIIISNWAMFFSYINIIILNAYKYI